MRDFLDSWHESGSPWEQWVSQVETLRARFAASIGADAEEIAVMLDRLRRHQRDRERARLHGHPITRCPR